jgi:hypothetical protein
MLQVAGVCVQALLQSEAQNKVVEIVASASAAKLPVDRWFANV